MTTKIIDKITKEVYYTSNPNGFVKKRLRFHNLANNTKNSNVNYEEIAEAINMDSYIIIRKKEQ